MFLKNDSALKLPSTQLPIKSLQHLADFTTLNISITTSHSVSTSPYQSKSIAFSLPFTGSVIEREGGEELVSTAAGIGHSLKWVNVSICKNTC
jgi:hypothetical protein